ncbi:GNAT family N-acetyltransferase [Sphingosinicella sp. LHD-64]|uniref:GNAT family N-acetyltransferase n=1 Tax=Sphingosinicella sp. LHD-64 TaxID=3072139 RepID=UPI00280F0612|nr:GNAT family N-acetyltransferase [Sphingosinicella sp. LHD-64]MDQ8755419.1 GNAT family N-acetyltransferase [Sphingosinicella sp. LHD-64]
MSFRILPYDETYRAEVLALSLRSWAPVFAQLEPAVPPYVYHTFYPDGWGARQTADIGRFLDAEGRCVWVACDDRAVLGWVGVRLHPEDHMGEVYILAVDPDRQRQGLARALLERALDHMRDAGMRIAMVETGDDPGHAPSRAAYERSGFERWPVARYFREL